MRKLGTVLVTSAIITLLCRFFTTLLKESGEATQSLSNCYLQNKTNLWRICKDNCVEQRTLFLKRKMHVGFIKRQTTRQNVIILSYPGAGSQVLGKLLNDNYRVFYLSEPLQPLAYYIKYNPSMAFSLTIHLLNDLFQCDFDDHEYFVDDLSNSPWRLQSRSLSSPPMCENNGSTSFDLQSKPKQSPLLCHALNTTVLRKLCLYESDATIARTTLMKSLESLSLLMEKGTFHLKVLHFVRNPKHALRAILSQQQLSVTKVTTKARKLCNQMLLNFKYGESENVQWLRGSYKLVKFEDLVANSTEVTQDVYKFFNFQVSSVDDRPKKISLPKTTIEESASDELEEIALGQCSEILKLLKY